MRRTGIVIVVLCVMLIGQAAWAERKRIAVVWIDEPRIFQGVYDSFSGEIRRDIKLIVVRETERYHIRERIKALRPDLILAIGCMSLEYVLNFRDIPIVYVAEILPQDLPLDQTNVSGVRMCMSGARQVETTTAFLPDAKNIRMFYTAKWTRDLAESAEAEARKHGINLYTLQVLNEQEYLRALMEFQDDTDAYIMLPDFVLTENIFEFLIKFSLKFRVPVVTFSPRFAKAGAVLSLGPDFGEMGRTAWEIADPILREEYTGPPIHTFVKDPHAIVNLKTVREMNAGIDTSALQVDEYVGEEVVSK